jgi:hypothetical protein
LFEADEQQNRRQMLHKPVLEKDKKVQGTNLSKHQASSTEHRDLLTVSKKGGKK